MTRGALTTLGELEDLWRNPASARTKNAHCSRLSELRDRPSTHRHHPCRCARLSILRRRRGNGPPIRGRLLPSSSADRHHYAALRGFRFLRLRRRAEGSKTTASPDRSYCDRLDLPLARAFPRTATAGLLQQRSSHYRERAGLLGRVIAHRHLVSPRHLAILARSGGRAATGRLATSRGRTGTLRRLPSYGGAGESPCGNPTSFSRACSRS